MNGIREYIKKDFESPKDRERNFSKIRALFDLTEEKEYTIDNITWNDLEMNKIYEEVDRTYSTVGELVLYNLLRNPLMEEEKLKTRSDLIEDFSKDLDLSSKIRYILFKLGFDRKNRLLDMLNGLLTINKKKCFLYILMGLILPIVCILSAIILKEPRIMLILFAVICINIEINRREDTIISGSGLIYLRNLISSSKKISRIKDERINNYSERIKDILDDISDIDRGTFGISLITAFGGLFEIISVPFLLEEIIYYKISGRIEEERSKIYELIYLVGELDALIGIASYKVSNNDKICTPEFIKYKSIEIEGGIVPILKNPVANNIKINNKGIVLTGTNMSGKSTFLRMVGTNILTSQCFNFAFAKQYKGCFFNIVSSISLTDDIDKGKSYYLAEAEAIIRVIKALDKEIPVFTLIDEIFRGTNPIERISSSAEILSYINKRNSIVIVATHDRELTDMLKEEYEFYYFSEDIDDTTGLKFDYKIKQGISNKKNAIKLLDYIGYPKEIINKSYKRCESLEKYI